MNQAFEPACTPIAPPWETPQVIPAQLRRVNNLIFRKIGQIARTNGVEAVTPMHGWIMEYLYRILIVLTAARRGSVPPHLVFIVYSVDYQGI